MNQNGMPMRFQLRDEDKIVGYEKWNTGESCWLYSKEDGKYWYDDYIHHTDKDQAIGATSSDDPPQELYFGDLIEFDYPDGSTEIGVICWADYAVCVRVKKGKDTIRHWFHTLILPFDRKIKKLGSRYTHPEILKKAGLE